MPNKNKLKLFKFYHEASVKFPCQICEYYTNSETAMRLHRKSRHKITEKYEHPHKENLCGGCHYFQQKCKCKKF